MATVPRWTEHWHHVTREVLAFFHCPRPLWRRLRTTNLLERCFVEVRRRTRRWSAS